MSRFEELLSGCKRRNQQSMMEMYNLCATPVYNASLHIVMNEFDAEEIMQDSILKAFDNIDRFLDTEKEFIAFVKRIAINRSIDHFRKNRKITFSELLSTVSASTIEARTIFKEKTFKNISFEINYYIMIPEDLYLVINNSYGNIEIDKLNKTLDLELDYGNFSIDSIFTNAKINVDYGNVKIKYANKVESVIGYGNIRINSGNEIYTKMKYGNINIHDVKSLTANCRYSDVEINLTDGSCFTYDISVSYGDIAAYYLKEKATRFIKEDNMTTIKGNIFDEQNAHSIKINLHHGDLDLEF